MRVVTKRGKEVSGGYLFRMLFPKFLNADVWHNGENRPINKSYSHNWFFEWHKDIIFLLQPGCEIRSSRTRGMHGPRSGKVYYVLYGTEANMMNNGITKCS